MTPARASSGHAAKRPMAATLNASLPLDASVLSIVANLGGLDINGLRRQWRAHLGGEPPAHLPRWLLMKVLAYRLQSDTFGNFDKSIRRILRCGKEDGVGAEGLRHESFDIGGWNAKDRPRFALVALESGLRYIITPALGPALSHRPFLLLTTCLAARLGFNKLRA
jgi:hypothetical protein